MVPVPVFLLEEDADAEDSILDITKGVRNDGWLSRRPTSVYFKPSRVDQTTRQLQELKLPSLAEHWETYIR